MLSETIRLTSWNIDAFSNRAVARAAAILNHILTLPSPTDIIFLQEVNRDVRAHLLRDQRVRNGFYASDAEDETQFQDVPFATMTLLSKARFAAAGGESESTEMDGRLLLGPVSRFKLPSHYSRDALCIDAFLPIHLVSQLETQWLGLRLINVHLDSLAHTLHYRVKQMAILADILRNRGRGLIAGDFNSIHPEDRELIARNGLVDAWVTLHGKHVEEPGGYTWGVGGNRRDSPRPGRLDKVAMMGLKALEMEVLRPGTISIPLPGGADEKAPWSDHSGLRCTFTVESL
jgi:tyrosyl-DNA phosphodiesterase 2